MEKLGVCFLLVLAGLYMIVPTSSAYEPEKNPPAEPEPLDNLLSYNYYDKSCPQLEEIVSKHVKRWAKEDYTVIPSLLRLHFHDCAVTGCDASILLDHDGSERRAEDSKTLRGFEVIDEIKAELEEKCPKTVSCADVLTAASRDATVVLGGPYWTNPYGRKDSKVSYARDAERVPSGRRGVTALLEIYESLGLDVLDLVVLSGAHTVGRAQCGAVEYRLFNYNATGGADPSIEDKYLNYLQRKCRWASEYVDLDATTPRVFDNQYYRNLEKGRGLLSTDQELYSDRRTAPLVSALADQPGLFHNQFGVSMAKLANVGVLTDEDEEGEVRVICSRPNY